MKVTDKRMFTPDGELRESPVNPESSAEQEAPPEKAPDPDISEVAEVPPEPVSDAGDQAKEPTSEANQGPPESASAEGSQPVPDYESPGFLDLVALLAEPTLRRKPRRKPPEALL